VIFLPKKPSSIIVPDNETLESALTQWKSAVKFFNEVTDPDMTEFAIMRVSAAREKFEYLLRKRRMRE
jgi:hypothetical protein